MEDTLDDIRFLADSVHRAVALNALADGSQTRAELRAVTGASSATVGRLLQAFEDRGWVTRDGADYALTALGEFVTASFQRLHHDMDVARELNELLPHVPIADIGVGVEELTDAVVTRATHANPFAVVSRVRELELDSARARSLTDFFPEPCIDGRHESVVQGTQVFEAVFAPIVLEAALASDAAEKFEAIVASDRADVRVYHDPIRHPVMYHDGVACLVVRNEQNVTVGLIETGDEAVVEWVLDVFEAHQTDATPVGPGDLAAYEGGTPAEA